MQLRLTYPEGMRFLFGDEYVVFNPLSWEVHILNPAASAVYDLLAEAPQSAGEIASLLSDLLVEDERHEAGAHATRIIGELSGLGLIAECDLELDDRR